MLKTADLDYELPPELIATRPASPRDSARLMVVACSAGSASVEHRVASDLPELLQPGDLLVFNVTRVLPARFRGHRVGTGGRIEGLYLHDADGGDRSQLTWICLIKGRHTRAGAILELHDREGRASGVRLVVVGRPPEEPEAWLVRIEGAGDGATREILDRVGLTPLPPYILKMRKGAGATEEADDPSWYQTVYARAEAGGSVAAPTAGLHFTPSLLSRLEERGIRRAEVVLHVGSGTFRPVETEFVEDHPMHAEWCSMSPDVQQAVAEVRAAGGRVIPVGTTALRTLEAYAEAAQREENPPQWLSTRLLVTPGYRFRWCDGLMTNFHLPRSTLMALVAAMLEARGCVGDATPEQSPPAGVELLKRLYAEAAGRNYRFYSFGDAMLIV